MTAPDVADIRTEAEYAYFMLLVAEARECEHPEAFRHRPPWRSDDPKEWRCGVCATMQAKR